MTDCARCGGSGEIRWDGKYVGKSFTKKPIMGPCIGCRPAAFCEKVGLKREAVELRAFGYE